MIRRLTALAVAVCALAAVPACGTKLDQNQYVKDALARTKQQTAKFIYRDTRSTHQLTVAGLVEDDFKFKARVTYDGRLGYDEVVSDDTMGMRFIDPARVGGLVDTAALAKADPTTDINGVSVRDALLSRRWVLDPSAAPAITETGRADADLGKDPVLDAITTFDYVSTALDQALTVKKWSKDDLDPAYLSDEDNFPKPANGSGVDRYDLVRPPLPPPGAIGTAGQAATPKTANFRRMAVYIKHGLVIKVLEEIDVTGKALSRLITYYRTFLKDQKAGAAARASLDRLVKTTSQKDLGSVLLTAGNQFLTASGAQPVLIRSMSLDLSAIGSKVTVAIPTDGVIHGSLSFLISAGKRTLAATGTAGSSGSGSGSSTSSGGSSTSSGGSSGGSSSSSGGTTDTSAPTGSSPPAGGSIGGGTTGTTIS